MAIYLCAVSKDAPENYAIGVESRKWGVPEEQHRRIEQVRSGDTLVFLVGGHFRSIHQVESDPFLERDPLWLNHSYPHRIRISEPLYKGDVRGSDLADKIAMFKKLPNWGLAVQGAKGTFNPGLSQADLDLIKASMARVPAGSLPPQPDPALVRQTSERQQTFFRLYEKDVEDHVDPILRGLGLALHASTDGRTGRQFQIPGGRIDLLCRDPGDDAFVVVELKKGEAPQDALLQTLRYMSYVRANLAQGKDVRGVILTEKADRTLGLSQWPGHWPRRAEESALAAQHRV